MITEFFRACWGIALLLGAVLAGGFAREAAAQGLGEGLDQTAIAWKTSLGAEWTYAADASAYGGGAIRSALNPDANSSAVWAAIDGPAQISFSWKTTSSAPNGFLIFFLDDIFYDEISGQTGWGRISFSIGAGTHTLYWSYLHDTAVPGDAGSAWLDHVETQSLAANPDCIPVLLRSSPEIKYPGQVIQVDYAVRNNGQAAWNTTWVDGLYFSSDETLDSSDENLGLYYETGSVDIASSYTRQTTLVLPRAAPGPYYLILSADDFNFIAESVEDNNLLTLPIVLSSLDQFPDLKPTLFTAPDRAQTGSDIEVSFTVENQGPVVAEGPWWDQIILSSDTLLDARDTLLRRRNRPPLNVAGNVILPEGGLTALPALTPRRLHAFLPHRRRRQSLGIRRGK